MKRLISTQSIAALAVALGTLAAALPAHARNEVHVSFDVRSPGVYVQPMPVYVQHRGTYPAPRTVYRESYPVYAPTQGHHWRHDRHHWERRGPYGDLDRDGIPNRYDRDRDGDGVRNRYDRRPNNPYYN